MRDVRYWYGTGTELRLHRTPLDCTEIPSISLLSKKNEDSCSLLLASDTPVRLVHVLSRCILTFIKFITPWLILDGFLSGRARMTSTGYICSGSQSVLTLSLTVFLARRLNCVHTFTT